MDILFDDLNRPDYMGTMRTYGQKLKMGRNHAFFKLSPEKQLDQLVKMKIAKKMMHEVEYRIESRQAYAAYRDHCSGFTSAHVDELVKLGFSDDEIKSFKYAVDHDLFKFSFIGEK